jgi:hypothetical protein
VCMAMAMAGEKLASDLQDIYMPCKN